jgi:hypothetical protein
MTHKPQSTEIFLCININRKSKKNYTKLESMFLSKEKNSVPFGLQANYTD